MGGQRGVLDVLVTWQGSDIWGKNPSPGRIWIYAACSGKGQRSDSLQGPVSEVWRPTEELLITTDSFPACRALDMLSTQV